jgi:hypothetical protein
MRAGRKNRGCPEKAKHKGKRVVQKGSTSPEDILSDLLRHTEQDGGCMVWKGGLDVDGYGRVRWGAKGGNGKVHRYVCELAIGKSVEGHVVRHTCHNRACINPDHLILGTPEGNIRDMDEAGRRYRTLTKEHILQVKALLSTGTLKNKDIADMVGIDPRRVSDIKRGYKHTKTLNVLGG